MKETQTILKRHANRVLKRDKIEVKNKLEYNKINKYCSASYE